MPGQSFDAGDTQLKYDAYAPADSAGGRPAIVFVSGAGEVRHWRWYQDYGRLAAAHGFVGFIPDKRYPRTFDGTKQGAADTEAFVEHIIKDSGRLGIDPNRICLWAFSAGGRIAALPFRSSAPALRCLVVYYGVLSTADQTPPPALIEQYSPEYAVAAPGARKLPTLVVRAGRDTAAINRTIDRFVDAAIEANVPLELINYPAGDHGFDGVNDTAESRRIITDTFRFIARTTDTESR